MMDVMYFFLFGGVAVVFAGLISEVQRFYDFPVPAMDESENSLSA